MSASRATAAAAAQRPTKEDLADELLTLRKRLQPALTRMEEIEEDLRQAVRDGGNKGFTARVRGKGTVRVGREYVREEIGTAPTLVAEKFAGLSEARQASLRKQGLVADEPIFSRAGRPRITVTLNA